MQLTKAELDARLSRFCAKLDEYDPDWGTAFFVGRVNQYYFTGTMQDALLIIRRGGHRSFFVRRSYDRAMAESPAGADVLPMRSYRDAAEKAGQAPGHVYIESEGMTLGVLSRLQKYFKMDAPRAVEPVVCAVRAVKSEYELDIMRECGRRHQDFADRIIPSLFTEGMSEADLTGRLYQALMSAGWQGATRFQMFGTEVGIGQLGFGTNALTPTSFDGPGGSMPLSPAVPFGGSRDRRLQKGDLVFVDVAFGMQGYHTDHTQVYSFGMPPNERAAHYHRQCIRVQSDTAARLVPGAVPSEIYREIMESLDEDFLVHFMGYNGRAARFLGHGIGLHVDETPVIARGFDEPLEANMVFALEPKRGVPGIGMVGVEDTYVVARNGGVCLTGGGCDIKVV